LHHLLGRARAFEEQGRISAAYWRLEVQGEGLFLFQLLRCCQLLPWLHRLLRIGHVSSPSLCVPLPLKMARQPANPRRPNRGIASDRIVPRVSMIGWDPKPSQARVSRWRRSASSSFPVSSPVPVSFLLPCHAPPFKVAFSALATIVQSRLQTKRRPRRPMDH
jgi:hypothetical protein